MICNVFDKRFLKNGFKMDDTTNQEIRDAKDIIAISQEMIINDPRSPKLYQALVQTFISEIDHAVTIGRTSVELLVYNDEVPDILISKVCHDFREKGYFTDFHRMSNHDRYFENGAVEIRIRWI